MRVKRSLGLPYEAIEFCRRITQKHSQTFYLGSCLFPSGQREAVWAVYAACRLGDDIVDRDVDSGVSGELEFWWQNIESAYGLAPSEMPLVQALHWAVSTYPIPKSAFYELYLGLKMDLSIHRYKTLADLDLYCRRVAGVVGFMIAPIGGFDGGEETLNLALVLGQAMQLTNILRDVGEDLARGRIYLPEDMLEAYGVKPKDLLAREVTPAYRALIRSLAGLARTRYREGSMGLAKLHGRGRLAVAVAAKAYAGILDALEANECDNFSKRAYVPTSRKLSLVPQAWWELHQIRP